MRLVRAGDGSADGEWLKRGQALHRRRWAKYGGYDKVPTAAALAEIACVIDAQSLGLQVVGDRRFVGPHGDHLRIVEVVAMKGAEYAIRWGLCLPYVPLSLNKPVRYGRTLKSARANLWWASDRGESAGGPERRGYIDTFMGLKCVHDDAEIVWRASRSAAITFWNRTENLSGVLDLAKELMTAAGADSSSQPPVGAVAALTAARMGLRAEAGVLATATRLRPDERELLSELIEEQLLWSG
jgi:hypothetical protein